MRYSIFEYSQEKLVSLGLDVTDALLLNWFVNFFCGKMEKQIFKDTEGNSKIYGWVKISKIIEDLPVIGISSEKGIRIRFDSFVEKGILDRQVVHTQKGKRSFYRTTSIYDSLINIVAIEKTSKADETTSNNNKILQRNCTTFAENQIEEQDIKIPQRKKTTYAENKTEQKTHKSSQRNCSSFAEGNCTTFSQRNSSSFALNDSLINDSLIINTSSSDKKNSEADFLIQKINSLFNNSITFSKDLNNKLLNSLSSSNILEKDYENYIEWAFYYLKERCEKQENFPGYFYKSISETALIYKFLVFSEEKLKKQQKKQEEEIICPICNNKHNRFEACPVCQNYYFDLINISEAERNKIKKIFNLPKDKKINYENEINSVIKNFPLSKTAINKDLKLEMDMKILEIEKKYNILEGS